MLVDKYECFRMIETTWGRIESNLNIYVQIGPIDEFIGNALNAKNHA